jgi:hypothetical protein
MANDGGNLPPGDQGVRRPDGAYLDQSTFEDDMTTSGGVAAATDTEFRQSVLATDASAAVRAVDSDDNQAGYRARGKRVVLRDGSTVNQSC